MENGTSIFVNNLLVQARDDHGQTKRLLDRVSFEIPPGHFVAIIGASGCGKSTLIQTLGGLIRPAQGRVLFGGHPVRTLKDNFPLAVGYLPQFASFHPDLTVEENLRHASALRLPRSVPQGVKDSWMAHIVELSRIGPLLSQPYRTLSGGQMRRIALAEELIGDPAFLLLDELTSGLDPFSDREMMHWLHELAHQQGKTILLVTHSINHLDYCDAIIFLHKGRLIHVGPLAELLQSHQVDSIADLYAIYQTQEIVLDEPEIPPDQDRPAQTLRTAKPPGGWSQFPTLLSRQVQLFIRERSQLILHLALIVTFPTLVAVFATKGLPQVRNLDLSLHTNVLEELEQNMQYMQESFSAASLISGLAMFQVVLLTLIGANNGAREIAKESNVLSKELRAGLSPVSYVLTKFIQVMFLCLLQAFWMAWFVKTMCHFPGDLWPQFSILFMTTLAMSTTCLAISAYAPSPERASLLAIYLVGFQLPLSGAALALPDWLSHLCRPFIVAYWGWSGYLKTLSDFRIYDIVKQSSRTTITDFPICIGVLALHVIVALILACHYVQKRGAK